MNSHERLMRDECEQSPRDNDAPHKISDCSTAAIRRVSLCVEN